MHVQNDIDLIEMAKKGATMLIPSFWKRSYEERMKLLNMTIHYTVETRRMRGIELRYLNILNVLII